MKQILKWVILPLGVVSAAFLLYMHFEITTYTDRTITNYAHVTDYRIISEVHDDSQWYVKIWIDGRDGERLLKICPFRYGENAFDLKSYFINDYIKRKPNCWYYLKKGQGPYGYILYCLNNNKSDLEIFELFGD